MPLAPLYGHAAIRARLAEAAARGALPSSLLLLGPRGVGKQQLALWLARTLLCERAGATGPCGECKACRMAAGLGHPDLHWFFPRPRLKDADASADEVREDLADAIAARLKAGGLYEAPGGDEGIFISTVRAIVHTASLSPAMGRRKVFVIGDAERMVPQEGSDQAANAFLKLLEEPLPDTSIILTSSEPGALLPTIRSRVVAMRVVPLSESETRAFLADPQVADRLDLPSGDELDELIRLAGGAPGRLIDREAWVVAMRQANRILDAATSADRGRQMRAALAAGSAGARGKFSDALDALTVVLHDRARAAAERGDEPGASGAARAVDAVEEAKEMASRNVNPQLLTASLVRQIAGYVG
ncbi:MAG TPA: hypothetical protein VL524_20380 [Gemmatimonadaceae bacterium]|nr:hypothetical protein [Gemmatimonadaceae bacterium]